MEIKISQNTDLETMKERINIDITHMPIVHKIYLYGSRIRGDWNKESDFDFYIKQFSTGNRREERMWSLSIERFYALAFKDARVIPKMSESDIHAGVESIEQYHKSLKTQDNEKSKKDFTYKKVYEAVDMYKNFYK